MTEAEEPFAPFHHHDCKSIKIEENQVQESPNHIFDFEYLDMDISYYKQGLLVCGMAADRITLQPLSR